MNEALAKEVAPYGLDEAEQKLLYNVEFLRLSVKRAGDLAGVASPHSVIARPHVAAAREQMRAALRVRTEITREDVIAGIKEAVDQAVILADPMAQIAGWREISKLLGYDKSPNVNIHINGTIDQVRRQMQDMPVDRLIAEAGLHSVMDADFVRLETPRAAD